MVRITVTINTMNVSKRSHRMTNIFQKGPTIINKTLLYNLPVHTHYIFGGVKSTFQYAEHLMAIVRVEELQIIFTEELLYLCQWFHAFRIPLYNILKYISNHKNVL
jgi:hypothetical protein